MSDPSEKLKALRPGQRAIMLSFRKHGTHSVYAASDMMDLRLCCVLVEKGLLARTADTDIAGYALTDAGRSAIKPKGEQDG